jgi:hypothetical protein
VAEPIFALNTPPRNAIILGEEAPSLETDCQSACLILKHLERMTFMSNLAIFFIPFVDQAGLRVRSLGFGGAVQEPGFANDGAMATLWMARLGCQGWMASDDVVQ